MPQWSNVIPADQGYVADGVFGRPVNAVPDNDILQRCRALTAHDVRCIVAIDPKGWKLSAEYVAGSAFYMGQPHTALNILLLRLPRELRELVWRGSWLSEEEVAGLPFEQLIAAAQQIVKVTYREKSPRDLALAAAEELQLPDELIGKLLGER